MEGALGSGSELLCVEIRSAVEERLRCIHSLAMFVTHACDCEKQRVWLHEKRRTSLTREFEWIETKDAVLTNARLVNLKGYWIFAWCIASLSWIGYD